MMLTRPHAWATVLTYKDIFVAHNVFFAPLYIPVIFVVTLYGYLGRPYLELCMDPLPEYLFANQIKKALYW
jgi:hypothetical protein